MDKVNLSNKDFDKLYTKYENKLTIGNRLGRLLWNVSYYILFRPWTLPIFKSWRSCILRMFGAKIGKGSVVHASTVIWAPWNLEIGYRTAIGPHVKLYNPGLIKIGNKCVVSQFSYLCTASHDITDPLNHLVTAPIKIEDCAWIAADAFVGMGVTIGQGAVVGARAAVFKDVEPWTVVGGNPAKFIKKRVIAK